MNEFKSTKSEQHRSTSEQWGGLRPWAKWFFERRMGWVVFVVLIIVLPVYLLIGCYQGAVEIAKEWAGDWHRIQRVVKQMGQKHD